MATSHTVSQNSEPLVWFRLLTRPGVSEEEIIEIFARQGQVVEFRLVYDQETSKPKGFGFLQYADPECAIAAVRNLNEYPIQGRTLRVAWTSKSDGAKSGGSQPTGPQDHRSALPPMPPGTESKTLSAPDAISKTLGAMEPQQLLDIISQMKAMAADNPGQVSQVFQAAPQLAYAIFQALLMLGLVDINVLSSIVAGGPAQQAPPPPPQQPIPTMPPPQPQYQQMPSYPPYGQPTHVPTPPQHMPFQPPPPAAAPPVPNQDDLIRQVLAMTREQIFALPPAQRDQLITLRAHFGAPVA